jgi:predicted XRE-type DNA-binding protein
MKSINPRLVEGVESMLFGVTQPRVFDLVRGKINLFALDALVNMATAAGMRVEMTVVEAV